MPESSKIFQGFKALGFVSNHIPLVIRYIQRRKENLIITTVDRCFHTYGSNHLKLLSVSNSHPCDISCISGDAYHVFTACDNVIYAWKKGNELHHTYKGHEKAVHLLLPFGPHLLSVDDENLLKVWDISSEELFLEIPFNKESFRITALLHPSTYLNKILLGSEQGNLQLWNLRTSKLIHTFPGFNSSVLVLEQAPAVDVVAVGLASGEIILHNLKFDETIVKFIQEWGPVTGLSFRTDEHAHLASSSPVGHVAVWDLEKRCLLSQIRDAHFGAVTGLKFLPSEPLLVTSSPDNSLKIWIFDQPDGSGRLLMLREGHGAPPVKIRFHGSLGHSILSAGLDSTLRSFSTELDSLNKNLGQASYNRKAAKRKGVRFDEQKMNSIVDFTSETTRDKEWDSIAACHRGTDIVTSWSYNLCKMGKHKLLHERFKGQRNVVATCVTLSPCGNFVVIGYNRGHVDKYNIQSGIHRGHYGKETAHQGAVRGVAVDGLSQQTFTAGSDKYLHFWKFKGGQLLGSLLLQSPAASMVLHRESGMIGVALDDQMVLVVDQETKRIVRNFAGHSGRVTDMTFSADARWLISASMDSTIRTWNLPSGSLIDCFRVSSACTSLCMSPTGEYLATAHTDDMGIYLWANSTFYKHVSLHPLPNDYIPVEIQMPGVLVTSENSENDYDGEETAVDLETEEFKSPEQISDELVTLSLLPHSQWKNLLNLDVIKQRNKPREPAQAPKAAPFFLPTVAGLDPTFAVSVEQKDSRKQISVAKFQSASAFGNLLQECSEKKCYSPLMEQMKEMGPSAIDVELRLLSPENGGTITLMHHFLEALNQMLLSNKNYELVQAYLGLFLKLHGDILSSTPELHPVLDTIAKNQRESWQSLQQKLSQSLCLVNFFRSAIL